jgi:hypothetical protein
MQNRRFPLAAACVAVPVRVPATLRYAGQRGLDAFRFTHSGARAPSRRQEAAVAPARSRRVQRPSGGMI